MKRISSVNSLSTLCGSSCWCPIKTPNIWVTLKGASVWWFSLFSSNSADHGSRCINTSLWHWMSLYFWQLTFNHESSWKKPKKSLKQRLSVSPFKPFQIQQKSSCRSCLTEEQKWCFFFSLMLFLAIVNHTTECQLTHVASCEKR